MRFYPHYCLSMRSASYILFTGISSAPFGFIFFSFNISVGKQDFRKTDPDSLIYTLFNTRYCTAFACKTDFSDLTCGTVLDIRLDPKSAAGEAGITAIEGLLKAFNELGGFFLQIDVVDNAVLYEAQKHPENYQSLAVRISGWSARFVTLNENWQQMVIERTASGV